MTLTPFEAALVIRACAARVSDPSVPEYERRQLSRIVDKLLTQPRTITARDVLTTPYEETDEGWVAAAPTHTIPDRWITWRTDDARRPVPAIGDRVAYTLDTDDDLVDVHGVVVDHGTLLTVAGANYRYVLVHDCSGGGHQ